MKKIYSLHRIAALLLAVIMLSLPACKKDGVTGGTPALTKVSAIKDLAGSITTGNMGDWIALHGSHLADIREIKFNDVVVDLEEIYEKDDVVYLQVPVKLPQEVTDKIYVTTPGGEVTYTFTVNSPDLELTGMFNEYTPPGDTIRIYGKFITLYEIDASNAVVRFGDIETPVISATDNSITARVPADVQPNVKVQLKSNKYDVVAECPGFYQDKQHVITTFDSDYPYTNATGQQWVGAWTNPKPTSGKYIRFEVNQATYPDGLGWFYLMENSYVYTVDMIQHPENYTLKFELNMTQPIKSTNFFIYYYWAVAPQPIGSDLFTVQTFGRWQTVSIPLEKIIPMGNTTTDTSFSLNFRVENFAPVETVAMYFDNLRIYKKGE